MTMTSRNFLKTISIIHLAMVIGPLFAATIFYMNTEIITNGTQNDIFIYVFPLIALGGIFASKYMFNLFIKNLKNHKTLQAKLTGYQTASLIKYALIEGPAFLNIVWFSQTGNLLFLTIGGVLIIFLFTQRPRANKIEIDLNLNSEHKSQFRDLDRPM
ncbi:hypothetical protein [Croceitalea vernalis]|uniref:MFS transporter n=1 Tax=Croceitalea vernalis TaxID=3075599 RepID=A0ABU3BG59_9FLAO|nr:hypothetical protein [Croceitalea sp. P007]MDT0621165.1 hypothetical protein [Croceitalea sp. P007]